jgi:DNA-directed RNA polymerase specialized sigma24 family protein
VARNQAAKRAVVKEQSVSGDSTLHGLAPEALGREPEPSEAVALAEELEFIMRQLKPDWRRILELRLDGHKVEEIAGLMRCSERRVRRCFEDVRELMRDRLNAAQA